MSTHAHCLPLAHGGGFAGYPSLLGRLQTAAKTRLMAPLLLNTGELPYSLDSRNRQMVTSTAMTEAGTACSEDVAALACRERTDQEVRDTYLRRLRYP